MEAESGSGQRGCVEKDWECIQWEDEAVYPEAKPGAGRQGVTPTWNQPGAITSEELKGRAAPNTACKAISASELDIHQGSGEVSPLGKTPQICGLKRATSTKDTHDISRHLSLSHSQEIIWSPRSIIATLADRRALWIEHMRASPQTAWQTLKVLMVCGGNLGPLVSPPNPTDYPE